jgi:CyaY protein
MTESEFLDRVAAVWREIETRVDQWAQSLDAEIEANPAGPVLELDFASGRQIVVNAQTPMRQVWLASPRGAWHFQWTGETWRDTRSDADLWSVLTEQAAIESGAPLS